MFQNPQQKNNMCICHNWRWSLDDNRTLDVCCRLLSPNFELDQVDHLRRFVWAAVGVVNGYNHGTNPHHLVSCLYNDGYKNIIKPYNSFNFLVFWVPSTILQ